jgi:exosortase/archaeosortase family protein
MLSKKYRRRLIEVLKFIVIFNLLAIPMYAVLYFNLSFEPLKNFLAFLTTKTLELFGVNAVQQDAFVNVLARNQLLSIEISFDSTGWKTLYALFALVLATPKKEIENKLKFLSWGIPLLFVVNFLRIVTTIMVAVTYGFQYFDVVHIFLWREGLIAAVVVLWYLWLRQK